MQRALDRLQQRVVNPVVKLGWDLGIPIPGDALADKPPAIITSGFQHILGDRSKPWWP